MKSINFKTIAAGLVAGMLLLSSCSVEKRHYLSGYAVQWKDSKNKNTAPSANRTNSLKYPQDICRPEGEGTVYANFPHLGETKDEGQVAGATSPDTRLSSPFLASAKSKSFAKPEKPSSYQSQVSQHNLQTTTPIKLNTKAHEAFLPFVEKAKVTNKKSSGSDTDLIIEIILCFFPFINLIAMYLKDGKRITLNFWVDLILDILFFLPGIIFALLVVLDVVNLA